MFQTINIVDLLPLLSAAVVIPNMLACPVNQRGFGTPFTVYFSNLYPTVSYLGMVCSLA